MGSIALIVSVAIDAVWPLRGRTQDQAFGPDARSGTGLGPGTSVRTRDDEAADPLADPFAGPLADAPYDPLLADLADPPAPSRPHPLERYALSLIDGVAADTGAPAGADAAQRQLSLPGWLVVVGVPMLVVACAQWLLGTMAGLLVFVLHVGVLYLSVGLGEFYRRFSALRLLIAAGEQRSAAILLVRWVRGGSGWRQDPDAAPAEGGASLRSIADRATAQAILAAYREVFAPLFWYAVLPGAIGPVLYLFSRFAACNSHPFARTALYCLDWIPMRVASLGFALVGRFEDAVFCLRSVSAIRQPAVGVSGDPYLHQRLLLLPVAGGAMGLRLKDPGVDAHLRTHAPDFDLPGGDLETSLQPVAGLLLRSAVVWVGVYLLAQLLI